MIIAGVILLVRLGLLGGSVAALESGHYLWAFGGCEATIVVDIASWHLLGRLQHLRSNIADSTMANILFGTGTFAWVIGVFLWIPMFNSNAPVVIGSMLVLTAAVIVDVLVHLKRRGASGPIITPGRVLATVLTISMSMCLWRAFSGISTGMAFAALAGALVVGAQNWQFLRYIETHTA